MKTVEMARAAAHWWREKLERGVIHDNGDRSAMGAMAGIMADMLSEPTDINRLELFEKVLALRVCDEIENEAGRGFEYFSIGCDYGPEGILFDAARETGVSARNFPWKTWMWIELKKEKVMVRDGYHGPMLTIWGES